MDQTDAGACPFSGAAADRSPRGITRRSVLAGFASLAALPVVGGTSVAAAAPARTAAPAGTGPIGGRAAKAAHAVGDPRGWDIAVRGSRAAEGRFGLMFKE